MSDLDGTLSAITLEHLNHADGPRRCTITADGCTYFVRDTINVFGPRGSFSSTDWVKDRRTHNRRNQTGWTPRQIVALAFTHGASGLGGDRYRLSRDAERRSHPALKAMRAFVR